MRKPGLLVVLSVAISLAAQGQSLNCDLVPLGDAVFALDESDMRGKSRARERRLKFFTYEMERAELAALEGDFTNTLHALDQIGRRSIRRKGWLKPEAADAVNSALFELRSCLTTTTDEPVTPDDPDSPTDPTPPMTPTPPPPTPPSTNTPPSQAPTPPGSPGNPSPPMPPMPPGLPTPPEPQVTPPS